MATAWRVVKADHIETALLGLGAKRAGGRWNPPGLPAVYASDSLAMAMLEVLVHFDPALPMANYVAFQLDIPDETIATLRPAQWAGIELASCTSITACQQLGRHWLGRAEHLALRVPSAVVPPEYHLVINPGHSRFAAWLSGHRSRPPVPVRFDPRLTRPVGN
jgi:RES domain-containing protein